MSDGLVTVRTRIVQRRSPILVFRICSRTAFQQQLDTVSTTEARRNMRQRSRLAANRFIRDALKKASVSVQVFAHEYTLSDVATKARERNDEGRICESRL